MCSNFGVIAFDINFCYILWNSKMEEISGVKKEDVLGKNAFVLFPFLKEMGEAANMLAAIQGEHIVVPKKEFDTMDGKIYLQANYSPLYSLSGLIEGGLVVLYQVNNSTAQDSSEIPSIISVCANCKKIQTSHYQWVTTDDERIWDYSMLSHTICPYCMKKLYESEC